MSVYGWVLWGSKNKKIQKKISFSSTSEIIFSITISIIFYIIIYTILKNTDSDVIMLDSLTTSLSLTAMLLLARRKIENWIFWIIADLIYIPLFFYKGLYIASLQYFVFLILATSGYIEWKKNKDFKTPYFHYLKDSFIYMAGLYNDNGGIIVTIQSSSKLNDIHHRQPLLLLHEQVSDWLSSEPFIKDRCSSSIIIDKVSSLVNSPKNNSPECIVPV